MSNVTVIAVFAVAVAALMAALVVILAVRDRGRDRSADQVPARSDIERAASQGVPGYRHEAGGPYS